MSQKDFCPSIFTVSYYRKNIWCTKIMTRNITVVKNKNGPKRNLNKNGITAMFFK